MKNFVAIALAGLFAGTASAQVTVSIEEIATEGIEGSTTYVFSVNSAGGPITSLQGDFNADAIGQVNPLGMATVFNDLNGFFGADAVSADSQFRFASSSLLIGASSESSSNLNAAFTFPGTADFGSSTELAHVALSDSLLGTYEIGAVVGGQLQLVSGTFGVPEPASLGLLAAGAGLVGFRRRR